MAKIAGKAQTIINEFSVVTTVPVTANNGTATKVDMGYASNAKVGMRIRGIDYYFPVNQAHSYLDTVIGGSGGQLAMGLRISPSAPTSLPGITDSGVIDWNIIRRDRTSLTAVGFQDTWIENPYIVKNFTELYGDGKLVHPVSLYLWTYVSSVVLDATLKLGVKIIYAMEELEGDDYSELINQVLLERS